MSNIIELASIVRISDSNPIQFYGVNRVTFNNTTIARIEKKEFYQHFLFTDPMQLDMLCNSKRYNDWDATVTYNTGDVVYEPFTNTRWKSNSDANLNNNPNPANTDHPAPSLVWDHDPLVGSYDFYDFATSYETGDRVLAYYGAGTSAYVFQSLVDANLGDQPHGNVGVKWQFVDEATGRFALNIYKDNVVIETIPFSTPGDTLHQILGFILNSYPSFGVDDCMLSFSISGDDSSEIALTDCFDLINEDDLSIQIKYYNSVNFDDVDYTTAPVAFFLRLRAHFYEESNPTEVEDEILSNGVVVFLRNQTMIKVLLNIIEYLPDYMHRKVRKILMHDTVIIGQQFFKCRDEYQKSLIETSTLTRAKVLLTQEDSILVNIGNNVQRSRDFNGDDFNNDFA